MSNELTERIGSWLTKNTVNNLVVSMRNPRRDQAHWLLLDCKVEIELLQAVNESLHNQNTALDETLAELESQTVSMSHKNWIAQQEAQETLDQTNQDAVKPVGTLHTGEIVGYAENGSAELSGYELDFDIEQYCDENPEKTLNVYLSESPLYTSPPPSQSTFDKDISFILKNHSVSPIDALIAEIYNLESFTGDYGSTRLCYWLDIQAIADKYRGAK